VIELCSVRLIDGVSCHNAFALCLDQNRRQKFSIGGLCVSAGGLWVCAGGLDILKLAKAILIYSVSLFNFGGLGALFRGAKPTKAPRGDGTAGPAMG